MDVKLKNIFLRTLVVSLCATSIFAKEAYDLDDKEVHYTHNQVPVTDCVWCKKQEKIFSVSSPLVSSYSCSWCAYNDGLNRICIDSNTNLQAGWQVV